MGERAEDELRRVLDAGDVQACKSLLASMSETARRPFAKRASARLKEVLKGDFQETAPGRYEWVSPFTDAQREAARIAVLATATLAELKRLEWDAVPRSRVEEDGAIDFLREFRPAWLDEWAEALLEFSPETWRFARRLVRESILNCAHDPPGFSSWLPDFDSVVKVILIDLACGYYGWPDEEVSALADELKETMFGFTF